MVPDFALPTPHLSYTSPISVVPPASRPTALKHPALSLLNTPSFAFAAHNSGFFWAKVWYLNTLAASLKVFWLL